MARDTNGSAENRRELDEITSAYQQVEAENRRLRAQLEKFRKTGAVEKALVVRGQSVVVDVKVPPKPGKFVEYIDKRGHTHTALVLDQRAGALKIKVFVRAVPDVVVEVPEQSERRRVECWRRRA